MTIEEFFEEVIISDEEKEEARKFIYAKGVEKHNIIKDYLMAWHQDKKIQYSAIATTYRYDKRIRKVLFKYISYLEELYRGMILDSFRDDFDNKFLIKELKNGVEDGNLNQALEELNFTDLIKQVQKLPSAITNNYIFNEKNLFDNLKAVKTLRNAVMHNKFLILYRGFDTCNIGNGNRSSSLSANIKNLASFLPSEVSEKMKKEINECCKNGRESKSKWNLPKQIVVII